MEGTDIGSLSILTKENSNKAVSQKQYSGEQGTHWINISVELDLTPSTQVDDNSSNKKNFKLIKLFIFQFKQTIISKHCLITFINSKNKIVQIM